MGLAHRCVDGHGFVVRCSQASGAVVDAQPCFNNAVLGVSGVACERDLLAVVTVLLVAPKAYQMRGPRWCEFVGVCEASLATAQESEIIPGRCQGRATRPVLYSCVVAFAALAPLGAAIPRVATNDDPVNNCPDLAVRGRLVRLLDEPGHHAVRGHAAALGDAFVLSVGRRDNLCEVLIRLRGDPAVVKGAGGLLHVRLEGAVFDVFALDGVALDQRDSVAGQEVVSCLRRLRLHAGVLQPHPVAELHVVILPGDASTRLLASSGSTYFFVDKVSKMSKVSSALGRKR